MKNRIVLKVGRIRKYNAYVRKWANATNSDDLADLILATKIKTQNGHCVLKGA